MKRLLPLIACALVLPAGASLAKDRAVTDQERPKLEAALKEAGCSGVKMEFDDDKAAAHPNGKFEVDDATCQDGKKYDLTFDPAFKLLTKKLN
jgi:Peptidase propeptide and YPEB domain